MDLLDGKLDEILNKIVIPPADDDVCVCTCTC